MMQPILQLLQAYKWSIVIGLGMFIFCLLTIRYDFWIAILVVLLTIIGAGIGFIIDKQIDIKKYFK